MPGMDHTGPEGEGQGTGRGLGCCRTLPNAMPDTNAYPVGKGIGLKRNQEEEVVRGEDYNTVNINDKNHQLNYP
jgi:hypothetical protein